jgi:hypothetical protein
LNISSNIYTQESLYSAWGWKAEEEGFDPRQKQGTYLSSKQFTSALRPNRSIFPGVNAAEA